MTLQRPQISYFHPLFSALRQRSERAAQSLLGLGNEPLRQFLHTRLTGEPGAEGALLADPVFEPTFGWEESTYTMGQLAGTLLHRKLVEVMSAPPTVPDNFSEYAFPSERRPYKHQLTAWQTLSSRPAKSMVVTSGTGSGKTECFLIPILNSLVDASEEEGVLEGVRALFIYPLNALIKSQQDRLNAWTHGLKGKVRHCLYTGALKDEEKNTAHRYSGQVLDRNTLRASAPPLLVTNATMLEYMLVRQEDRPIIEQSTGKLRWIVLDEAHTYIGSQAAEMALLLRRVMLAFKVNPKDVRFVATSATFGSDAGTIESLRKFLADIGGIEPEQVEIVQGHRRVPRLATKPRAAAPQGVIASIEPDAEDSITRFSALSASKEACQLRALFTPEGQTLAHSLSSVRRALQLDTEATLRWLDVVTGTRGKANPEEEESQAFLPLRGHLFHNVIPTIRACLDPACPQKTAPTLADSQWPFGMVYTDERTHCDCGTLLLPLVSCQECNEIYLLGAKARNKLSDPSYTQDDDFALADDDEAEGIAETGAAVSRDEFLIVNRPMEHTEALFISRGDWHIQAVSPKSDSIPIQAFIPSACECPGCGAKAQSKVLLRTARIGAPFTLSTVISTLLEYCPPDKEPEGKPFNGRKMISFTDSRQGTARIAVKLQQDSERNRIRGLIYQKLLVLSSQGGLTPQEEQDLNELLAEVANGVTLRDRDKRMLADLQERQGNSSAPSLTWDEMVSYLGKVPDVSKAMLSDYFRHAPAAFSNSHDVSSLAGMLLAREFYRRPKRANSLETLGLVQVDYPKLRDIKTTPVQWPSDLAAWRDYLKVILDFFVRENSVLDIEEKWLPIIGAKIRPKVLCGPDKEITKQNRFLKWPLAAPGVTARPVLLLCKAFEWDVTLHQDQLNDILRGAWNALTQAKILEPFGNEYRLLLKNMSFKLPEHMSFCPVTRRFIDTPFAGLTPYTPRTDRKKVIHTESVTLPRPVFPDTPSPQDVLLCQARAWLENDSEVLKLRQQGRWTDIHDLVIEGGAYYRAAEHSAQQSQTRLTQYETEFKEGKINLLSCSTTMEMGVDIGGITVVAMNNVPPHPANYLQRAGRAGRRREGRALAMTVCKNTPHDQSVFHHPDWPFVTPMRMPKVSLQSPDLIQRHVNSWLLSYWFKEVIGHTAIIKLTAGAFLAGSEGVEPLARQFMHWCEAEAAEPSPDVTVALPVLTKWSVLAELPPARLLHQAIEAMDLVVREWSGVYQAVLEQRALLEGKGSAAFRAMDAQVSRIEQEYLLSELASRRFLPGYGFPTDIVSFDNRSWLTLRQEVQHGSDKKKKRFAELPSRDRITGLREYAPGAELVIDGLVYRSAGITLNWHIPATEEKSKEAQLLKTAWYCRQCGTSASAMVSALQPTCEQCGYEIPPGDVRRYLVPSGFAVDFLSGEPHNDITSIQFVPVKPPWLSIHDAEWRKLANPMLGQQRSSRAAHLFHHTSGPSSNGFALCLECGRAEPMLGSADNAAATNEQYLPKVFRRGATHLRLRGGKDDRQDPVCPGSENAWKIQQNVHLGHDSTTDALELMLANPENGQWLQDEKAAYSIAIALRGAIADTLGVQAEELGAGSKMIRFRGVLASVIQVFDMRSGGYASQAAELINDRALWGRVLATLSCTCQNACQLCLLGFDTRFQADRLDRHAALLWVNAAWLDKLAVPKADWVFGTGTQAETASLIEAIERELAYGMHEAVLVMLGGPADAWDLPSARYLRSRLHAWRSRGLAVHLRIPVKLLSQLSEPDRHHLAALALADIVVEEGGCADVPKGFHAAVSVRNGARCESWASDNLELATPDRYWGALRDGFKLLHGQLPWQDANRRLDAVMLQPPIPDGVVDVVIHDELDGPLQTFGQRFWHHLATKVPALQRLKDGEDAIASIAYEDRYVRNPATVATIVLSLHHACLALPTVDAPRISVLGLSYQREDERPKYRCSHDWQSDADRDTAFKAAVEYCGLQASVRSVPHMPHARTLTLMLASGRALVLQLDQGFSYWVPDTDPQQGQPLNFNFHAKNIGRDIAELRVRLKALHGAETQIYIKSK